MNLFKSLIAISSILVLGACSAKLSTDEEKVKERNDKDRWPSYADQTLTGLIFGQQWTAVTAIARVNSFDNSRMSLEIYPENSKNICSTLSSSAKPYVTISVPSDLAMATEFKSTILSGDYPLAFNSYGITSKVLVANKTKFIANDVDETGFNLSLYAQATEQGGVLSEINGSIHVTDCRKVTSFTVWNDLAGYYRLQSLDNVQQDLRPVTVKFDENNNFYDVASETYIRALVFPLYTSVSPGMDKHSDFGPMEGLGTTKIAFNNNAKTYTYSYAGPLNYKGMDVTMNLELSVTQVSDTVYVSYTLEIPTFVTKNSHQYVLVK